MFSFFRRRKKAEATARRIIDQGRFLGARTPREAVEMLWGRPLTENEWDRYAGVWERIWQECLREPEMRPPYQLRLAIMGRGALRVAQRPVPLLYEIAAFGVCGGRQIAEAAVRSDSVVVVFPKRQNLACMDERCEQRLVQRFEAQTAKE